MIDFSEGERTVTTMTCPAFTWERVEEFLNRASEIARLEQWWTSSAREPVAMVGRRRVGKSWLFRKFADGKPALILVAEQLPTGALLDRFSEQLEPVLGVRPALPDVRTLFEVLFRAAQQQKILVVLDEFPWLLGTTQAEQIRVLSSLQAVMEQERDRSHIKLVLCGSHVGIMESLFTERNPLHGRLQKFEVRPLSFAEAGPFLDGLSSLDAFERYAVAGGMPLYLSRLGAGALRDTTCDVVLARDGALWDEGRTLIEQELREPRMYFGVLSQLATGAKEVNELAQALHVEVTSLPRYLQTLTELRLVQRDAPFGAPPAGKTGQWVLADPFLRFWFRFVFPFQADLDDGLHATNLFDTEVAPNLADHVAPVFEDWCRAWLRTNRGLVAPKVGRWWGNALDEYRRTKERSSEEIDAVGQRNGRVTVVAEAKWTATPMPSSVVDALTTYKIPALRQQLKVVAEPRIVLFCKSGYTQDLVARAAADPHIELVDVAEEMTSP